jgi:putative transposase
MLSLVREHVNGILSVLRTGCSWQMLPHEFPPFETVKTYFYKLKRDGTWARLSDFLRVDVRRAAGRDPEPSLLIADSQSVKPTEKGGAGRRWWQKGERPQAPSADG